MSIDEILKKAREKKKNLPKIKSQRKLEDKKAREALARLRI